MPELRMPSKDGGAFMAYIAMPKKLPAPTVVMIQEIFGVNKVMRDKCDDMARKGFIAVCPDLFWRLEPGVQLTDKSEAEWAKAFDLYNRFDVDTGVDDLRAAEHTMKGHAESTGMVGCVGYCLGGKLAYLMSCRSSVDAAVSYYGVGIEGMLSEKERIRKPLLLHIAEKDKFVSTQAQKTIHDGLKDNKFVTMHTYKGMDHAFAREGGEHYNAAAAELANDRTLEFLKTYLCLKD